MPIVPYIHRDKPAENKNEAVKVPYIHRDKPAEDKNEVADVPYIHRDKKFSFLPKEYAPN